MSTQRISRATSRVVGETMHGQASRTSSKAFGEPVEDSDNPYPLTEDGRGHKAQPTRKLSGMKRALSTTLLTALVASGFAVGAAAGPAYASGYYNNWPGNPEVNYAYKGALIGQNLQKFSPTPVPGLRTVFDNAWSASGAAVCNTIKGYLLDALGSFEEWTCSLPSNGDLLGGLVGPNELGLKYQVNGISIGLDYEKDGDWANINGTFDAQLAITLGVASSINGSVTSSSSPYGTTPVSINSSQVSFSDADFSSANVLLHIFAPNALPQAQSELDSTVLKGVASLLRLTSDVTTINSDLHTAASWIASLYVLSSDPEATQMFSLSLGVDAQHVTFTLGRGGSPAPQPSGCNYYPDDTYPGYTEVDAICSPDQPRGVTQLQLQELTSGSWRDDPADTTFEPGAPGGPESSWLAPPPYVDWSPNNGPDSGYAPLMTDYPSTQWVRPGVPSATVQMRVCSTNKWGLNCDAPVAVAQNQQLASTGGGSGGGGGGYGGGGYGGGGGGYNPPATPYQPPGTKRHCGEPGVYCAE